MSRAVWILYDASLAGRTHYVHVQRDTETWRWSPRADGRLEYKYVLRVAPYGGGCVRVLVRPEADERVIRELARRELTRAEASVR